MSDCALFPASPCKKRVYSVWADKESVLSLDGRAFTFIVWTVKLVLQDLALAVIYGLITVIHAKRIARADRVNIIPVPMPNRVGFREWGEGTISRYC
jgi:hypothetical protein